MKHLLCIFWILLLFIACSKEENTNMAETDRLVRVSAKLPDKNVSTRAVISIPESHRLRSIIEVRSISTEAVVYREEKIVNSGGVDVSFEFKLPDGNYECLLWTDMISNNASEETLTSGNCSYLHYEDMYYNTTDLRKVMIWGDGQQVVDTDLCDAFCARTELKKGEGKAQYNLKLIRPFSKLSLKENDVTQFSLLGKMNVVYEIPAGFNISTGEPLDEVLSIEYEKIFEAGNVSQELFTTYVFASSSVEGKGMNDISFEFHMEDGTRIDRVITKNTVYAKRNTLINVNGNLIKENEITIEPEVGYFFFKDGTWGADLTEENKGQCVGIIYAVGEQKGDNIANYGIENAKKKIIGYVVAMANISIDDYTNVIGESITSGRPHFYNNDLEGHSDKRFTAPEEIDRYSYNGYTETEKLLLSSIYTTSPEMYISLYILADWRKKNKVLNASDWYIPSIRQLMTVLGKFEGHFACGEAFPEVVKDDKIVVALDKAKQVGIDAGLNDRRTLNITISSSDGNPVEVERRNNALKSYKEDRTGWFAAHIRPVLTILK